MALTYRLFGIPIRIHAWFVLTAAFLFDAWGVPWSYFPLWALVVLQGVLMHEFGHALTGRAFGLKPLIELTAFAGVTRWANPRELSPFRSMLVSFAGPAVGIVIGIASGVALIVWSAGDSGADLLEAEQTLAALGVGRLALMWVLWVNLGWAVFNLVPIMPLDGGNIMAAFFRLFSPKRGTRIARYVSLAMIGALGAVLFSGVLPLDPLFTGIFLMFFAVGNVQALRAEKQVAKHGLRTVRTPEDLLQVGYQALEKGDGDVVVNVASILARNLPSNATSAGGKVAELRDEAFHLLAWGRLLQGDASEAQGALDSLSGNRDPDPALAGSVALALGRTEDALNSLETAMTQAPAKFVETRWVEAVEKAAAFERALAFAESNPDAIAAKSLRVLSAAATEAGDLDAAARLGAAWFAQARAPEAAFQVACCFSLLGREEPALVWLERARQSGFSDLALLDDDDDLEAVRAAPGWLALRARFD